MRRTRHQLKIGDFNTMSIGGIRLIVDSKKERAQNEQQQLFLLKSDKNFVN